MAKTDITIIIQLAEILNRFNAAEHFLQLMLVYKKVKKGYFPQTNDDAQTKKFFENDITPLLRDLGLYVSFKHGGYVTYDKELYKSWDGFGFYVRKRKFGSYYLGYPNCCELRYNLTDQLLSFHVYYIIQRILINKDRKASAKLDMHIGDLSEIEEYQPCVVGCPKTHQRAQAFREVRKEFSSFLPSDYLAKREKIAKESLLDSLKPINYQYTQRTMKKLLPLLKKNDLRHLFQLDDQFFEEVEEFLDNPNSKKEMVARAVAFIMSI